MNKLDFIRNKVLPSILWVIFLVGIYFVVYRLNPIITIAKNFIVSEISSACGISRKPKTTPDVSMDCFVGEEVNGVFVSNYKDREDCKNILNHPPPNEK